jgi:hypothetical protein
MSLCCVYLWNMRVGWLKSQSGYDGISDTCHSVTLQTKLSHTYYRGSIVVLKKISFKVSLFHAKCWLENMKGWSHWDEFVIQS